MKWTRSAFTLIEMLVVVAIIMILMGLLFPAFSFARQMAKKTKAKNDVKQLDIAWKGVLSDYRIWPASVNVTPVGGDMDRNRVAFLMGDIGMGNVKGIAYMEFDGSSTNSDGSMIDPWYHRDKNPAGVYQVALGQNTVSPLWYSVVVNRSVAAWSLGADGKSRTPQERKDDVKSWE